MHISEIPTPSLVVDLDDLQFNLDRMAAALPDQQPDRERWRTLPFSSPLLHFSWLVPTYHRVCAHQSVRLFGHFPDS